MHEMQTIVTDDRGVCQSVYLSRILNWLDCAKAAERIQILFGVKSWAIGAQGTLCQLWILTPNNKGEGSCGEFAPLWNPYISQKWMNVETSNSVHISRGRCSNQQETKVIWRRLRRMQLTHCSHWTL